MEPYFVVHSVIVCLSDYIMIVIEFWQVPYRFKYVVCVWFCCIDAHVIGRGRVLKVVDYVNSLLFCEDNALFERELVLKRLITNVLGRP